MMQDKTHALLVVIAKMLSLYFCRHLAGQTFTTSELRWFDSQIEEAQKEQ